MGFTWVARSYRIEYRSALMLNDVAVVRTWIAKMGKVFVDVAFEIDSRLQDKTAARGLARFVLIDERTKKPIPIPKNVVEKYSI